ncbi:unnamed protein product [Dicrocoelium dendriticum]|nr:unnamed protein product [Dicrocoelium dendriticum]
MKYDAVIFDLNANPNQIDEVLWVATEMEKASGNFETQKKFILISNLLSWTTTKPNDPDDPGFVESEYRRRKPHERFTKLHELEKEIIKLGKKRKRKFVTYVIACGLIYGCGEYIFQHFFRQAWSEQSPLPIYYEGQNVLPTIHVLDLANIVQNILDNPPRQRYIVAKDDSANTLAEIVQAISTQLSRGTTLYLPTAELVRAEEVPQRTLDQLTMDLRIDAVTIKEEMQVRWVCENGLVENISRVTSEFVEANGLMPLRLCVLGPPGVGKTGLSKELCKTYRLHHIHLKAVIFEVYRNLIEPIRALERLHEMRKAEQLAAEAAAAARQRELELAEMSAAEEHEVEKEEILEANAGEAPAAAPRLQPRPTEEQQPRKSRAPPLASGTYETTEYEEYKYTLTADEVPSIRRSTYTESMADMDYYPLDPPPTWKSEEELELLVSDAQEQLDNLAENTDENGRLNDETLMRLVVQKLLSHPCQNQGFVLDGFPKTIAQAELLFRPDPADEESMADEKRPASHKLLLPHHVFMLQGSNAYVLHRLNQQAEACGIDPTKARVIPPIWPIGFRTQRTPTIAPNDSYFMQTESVTNEEHQTGTIGEDTVNEVNDDQGHIRRRLEELETYYDRFRRRLDRFRALMAPAAARHRDILVASAERIAMDEAEAEQERVLMSLRAEITAVPTTNSTEEIVDDEPEVREGEQSEDVFSTTDQVLVATAREAFQLKYKKTLQERLSQIPALPEVPGDEEENVLTYFDIREVHPLCLDMDKDFSKVTDNGAYRELCMQRIVKCIGRSAAVPLPTSTACPLKAVEQEYALQLQQRSEKQRHKRVLSARERLRRQSEEDKKLLAKQQAEWDQWLELIKTQRHQCAEAKALPMRHYLMKYVIPDLTQALLASAAVRPNDPIDFVAEYLLKNGAKL